MRAAIPGIALGQKRIAGVAVKDTLRHLDPLGRLHAQRLVLPGLLPQVDRRGRIGRHDDRGSSSQRLLQLQTDLVLLGRHSQLCQRRQSGRALLATGLHDALCPGLSSGPGFRDGQ